MDVVHEDHGDDSDDGGQSLKSPRAHSDDSATSELKTSKSVLPRISTKEARRRLPGSANARGSLMFSEELKRFFPENKMRLFIGTWNMAEMKNPPGSIKDFLLPKSIVCLQDVYVIGTQESTANRPEWELSLQETLGPQMVLFHSASFGALHMCVFMRRELIWYCSVTEEAAISTRPGPSGIKTKGGLGVCFNMFGTSFLFIDSHFTAHEGKLKERINDYNKICAGLNLPKEVPAAQDNANSSDVTTRFDYVFWMGDLNFRRSLSGESVAEDIEKIDSQDYEQLFSTDELDKARAGVHEEETEGLSNICSGARVAPAEQATDNKRKAFSAFKEKTIMFKPTFKFEQGEQNYNQNRVPSYTDRILYRSLVEENVKCLRYDAAHSILDSDHHPVFGTYEVVLQHGSDRIPLSGGKLNNTVWKEGIRRHAQRINSPKRSHKSSSICVII